MLAHSYLILSPARPDDIASAVMTQRQSIPFVWALASASPNTRLVSDGRTHYFDTTVGDALALLDRGLAAWNYNSYFRDTLAPVGVFRNWLANNPSDTHLYLNISELIQTSPTPEQDLEELRRLPEKAHTAILEIEGKEFSRFLTELRRLSYPLITIPITGDREVDLRILSYEIRNTSSVEAEMALQMVGVDRNGSMLRNATESIKIRSGGSTLPDAAVIHTPAAEPAPATEGRKAPTLFTSTFDDARQILVEKLGCRVIRDGRERLMLDANGTEFMLVKLGDVGDDLEHRFDHHKTTEDHRYS